MDAERLDRKYSLEGLSEKEREERLRHRFINSARHHCYRTILPISRGEYEHRWFEVMEFLKDIHPSYRDIIDEQIANKRRKLFQRPIAPEALLKVITPTTLKEEGGDQDPNPKKFKSTKPEPKLVSLKESICLETYKSSLIARLIRAATQLEGAICKVEEDGIVIDSYSELQRAMDNVRRLDREMVLFHMLAKINSGDTNAAASDEEIDE